MTVLNSSAVRTPAILALADGSLFSGISFGALGESCAEVVFDTAMTGYQEILTDPSYCGQIITLTAPHIGNVGVNAEDDESDRIHASGSVIRDDTLAVSNWRAEESLAQRLKRCGIAAIAGVDTRRLTRHLRVHGAQSGCIQSGPINTDAAIARAGATGPCRM